MVKSTLLTYAIEETSSFISEIDYAQTLLLHVGINILKSQPAKEVFTQFSELVNEACQKSHRLVISLPTPSRARYLNNRVHYPNNLIRSKL